MSSADAAEFATAAGDVEDDAFGVVELLDHSDADEASEAVDADDDDGVDAPHTE